MKSVQLFFFLLMAASGVGQTTVDSGLVAYLPFCGNASDQSGHNNHGTIIGGVTFTEDQLGNPNSAAHFNGANGFVRIPASASLDTLTKSLTLACWFYTKGYDSKWASLLSKSNSTPALRQYSIIYDKDGLISFGHNLVATQVLALNKWYHIAVTYEDSLAKCYIDGILIDSNTIVNNIVQTNFPLNIGADPHIVMEYHYGMIDEVRVYNRALSSDEVGAVASYHLDCSGLSIKERGNYWNIKLYPNPTAGLLTLEAEDLPHDWSLKVYDSLGKLVQTGVSGSNNDLIDLTGLKPGIYYILIEADEGAYTQRVVKM